MKEGKRVLGRFHFDKWAGEEGSKIPKSFVKAFEKLAETGKLPGKVLRELAEHAPATVKVFDRAAPVIGAVLALVIADQANASETETFKRVSSLSQEMFGKKFGELTDDEKSGASGFRVGAVQ